MAGAVDIVVGDLNARFTARYVRQVFCDDGSTQPDGSRVVSALSTARRISDAILLSAWTAEQIETLVAEDEAVKSAVLDIAMSEGMAGRPQWDSAGGPRERLKKSAIETLKLLAQGQLRSIAEWNGAGRNPHTTTSRARTERVPHSFVFAPTAAQRRGGF